MRLFGRTPVALALQGGGALGAFTWGLLDTLLACPWLSPRAFSGASAGAMNAVVTADGLLAGGPEEARARLAAFWAAVGEQGGGFAAAPSAWESFWRSMGVAPGAGFAAFDALMKAASPYDRPLDPNPLRAILEDLVDFERLRRARRPAVFIAATDLRTGDARVFTNPELTPDVLLASACLPGLFRAVDIDGAPYWDGGYSANPPLVALLRRGLPRHVLLAPLNPLFRETAPETADDIAARVNEVTFHAPYVAELKALALAKRLAREGGATRLMGRVRRLQLHVIDADHALADASAFAKINTAASALEALRASGQRAAEDWLAARGRRLDRSSALDFAAVSTTGVMR